MALVVEDGTGLSNAESYASIAAINAYATARGLSFPIAGSSPIAAAEQAARRATAWVNATYRTRFSGKKVNGRAQALEWPREDATDADGEEVDEEQVPIEIINATAEAAIRELATPGSLSPDVVQTERVLREKVGDLEVQYADVTGADAARPIVSVIDGLLSGLLTGSGSGTTKSSFFMRA